MKFNDTNVAQLKLPDGKSELIIFDEKLPGFGYRIRAGGKRTWIVQYRLGEKQRRMTLGNVAVLNCGQARSQAKDALSKVQLQTDPQMEKVKVKAQAALTLGRVVDSYLTQAEARLKPRSFVEVERHLRNHWSPLSELALANIKRPDVSARLAVLASENGRFASNRARAALSALFSWAIGEGIADTNPVVGTNKATDELSRDRVLTDEELGLIWAHAGKGGYGAIVRLLILTGQRREEVGGMLWSELRLSEAVWSIDSGRTKNGRPHDVPLTAAATNMLAERLKPDDRDLVFGDGDGAFQGWSNAKTAMDKRVAEALAAKHGRMRAMATWRLHDIRRTVATRMVDLGVQPHIVEAILNHVSGHRAGVAGVYNRATYAKEKRAALEAWTEHVNALAQLHHSSVVKNIKAGSTEV